MPVPFHHGQRLPFSGVLIRKRVRVSPVLFEARQVEMQVFPFECSQASAYVTAKQLDGNAAEA